MSDSPTPVLTPAEEDAALKALSLNIAQVCFDLAGVVDPTPVCAGVSTIIALARGDWFSAALSGAGMIPFVGELAKFGKLAKDVKIVEEAIKLAGNSENAARILTPLIQKISQVLDLFPTNAGPELAQLRKVTNDFLSKNGVARVITSQLPDISKFFSFRKFDDGRYLYQEASGKLGVPGKVMQHRNAYAQSKISSGTGDDAGHLIGNRFGPPGTAENLGAQNFIQNRFGTFSDLEDAWAKDLDNGIGIEVKVQDVTRRGEDRPFMRKVEWTETSPSGRVSKKDLTFANTQTPRSRINRGIPDTVPPGNTADIYPFLLP